MMDIKPANHTIYDQLQTPLPLICLVTLTLVSGLCDAQGFVYAARMWEGGALVKTAAVKSLLYFQAGMTLYFYSLRFLQQANVVSPELQSLFWFSVTLIGVAVINGRAAQWSGIDRLVAVLVLCGIGWLLLRTGG
jgi:hypothetical protein